MKIFIAALGHMGDVILNTPCIAAIRQAYPDAGIWICVREENVPVIRENPHLTGVIPYELQYINRVFDFRKTLFDKCGSSFDLAFEFVGSHLGVQWVYASDAPLKFGLASHPRIGWTKLVRATRTQHYSQTALEVVELAGVQVRGVRAEIHLNTEASKEVDKLLSDAGVKEKSFILLNPFSARLSKCWPEARFSELIKCLGAVSDLKIVISGGAGEELRAENITNGAGVDGILNLVGKLSLEQSLCLYKKAKVMVSGDTGPMHAAAVLGTSVVALFGPSLPEISGPLGVGHRILQGRRPRYHTLCLDTESQEYMEEISVSNVLEAIQSSLTHW